MDKAVDARLFRVKPRTPFPKGAGLSTETVATLASRYKEKGDIEARNAIVNAFQPMVRRWARRYQRVFPYMEYDEFMSLGTIALIRAIKTFDPSVATFATHARSWLIGQMTEKAADAGSDVKIPHVMRVKMRAGKEPPPRALTHALPLVADGGESDDEQRGALTEGYISFTSFLPDEQTDNRLDAQSILENLERFGLSTRQISVFRSHFADGVTLPDIARRLGVTRQRVQQLYNDGIVKIRAGLNVTV